MLRFSFAALAAAGFTCAAGAQFIGIEDFDNDLFEDFSGFNGAQPDTFDLGNGIIIENNGGGTGGPGLNVGNWGSYFDNLPEFSGGNALNDGWGASDLMFYLPADVMRFGIAMSTGPVTTYHLEFFDANDNMLASGDATMPNGAEAVFLGYQTQGAPIARVRVWDVENGNIGLFDDIRIDFIPAPGTAALLGLGGLAACRRRR